MICVCVCAYVCMHTFVKAVNKVIFLDIFANVYNSNKNKISLHQEYYSHAARRQQADN